MARGRKWTADELEFFKDQVGSGLSNNQLANYFKVSVGRISQLRAQVGMLIRPRKVKNVVGVETDATALSS